MSMKSLNSSANAAVTMTLFGFSLVTILVFNAPLFAQKTPVVYVAAR